MISNGDEEVKKEPKLFIPRKLDSGKTYLISTGQRIAMIAFGFLYGVIMVILFSAWKNGGSGFASVFFMIVWTFFCQKFFRKIILKEKRLMERYMDFLEGQITDLLPFWNIIHIGETSSVVNAGRITYRNGVEAYIIEAEREYALGRPKGFKALHYTNVTNAITHILSEGYNYVYYNYELGTPNTEPLQDTVANLRHFRESPIYKIVSKIINYVRELVGNVPVEVEYYLVYTTGMVDHSRKLRRDCEIMVDHLRGGLYGKAHILNKEECVRFFLKYHGLQYFDEKMLYRKFGRDSDLAVLKNVKHDEAGNTLKIDDNFDVYDGSSAYDELVKEIYKARGENLKSEDEEK